MSYQNIINSLKSNTYSPLNPYGLERDNYVHHGSLNHVDFPPDLEMQMPRAYSAMSSPLPRSPPRPIPSPGSRWIDTTDRRGDLLPESGFCGSSGLMVASENTPLMQHCHHLSLNISISVPGSPASVNISTGMVSPVISNESIQQPSMLHEFVAAIPQLILSVVQSLMTASRLVLIIVLAFIIGLTILGNLSSYMFPLLCLLEGILWQNDQAGFCTRV